MSSIKVVSGFSYADVSINTFLKKTSSNRFPPLTIQWISYFFAIFKISHKWFCTNTYEPVEKCHSEVLAEESQVCNMLNLLDSSPAKGGVRMT